MINALENWSPYFLYAILLFILLAVLVGIGIIVITSLTIKRAAKKKPAAPAVPQAGKEEEPKASLPWLDKVAGFARKILIHWGVIPKDELSRAFITAKKLLRKYIGGPNYMYQIPWYLMLGTEKSGKTSLLDSLNIELPIGRPDFEFEEVNPVLGWWFYDRGIILDVRGDQILQENNPKSDEENWKYILSLITAHRPKRPLDGIILTIPSTELIGPSSLTEDAIFDRAKHLYRKLWQIQAKLAMRLPVYVIVTKCDRLTGFDQNLLELPSERLNEMLGWSNPYSIETAYSPAWSEKVFQYGAEALRRIRALVFTEGKERQERDGEFLLSQAFRSMSKTLSAYLNNTFKESAYHESFFLRGVYFVGDSARISPEELSGENYPSEDTGEYIPAKSQITFIRDLFVEKIFKEAELAQPVMRVLLSTSRMLNLSKVVVFCVSLIWLMGIFLAQDKLQDTKRTVSPLLEQIDRAVEGSAELDVAGKEAQLALYLKDQSNSILDLMTPVSRIRLFSLAIPASWLTPLESHLREVLTFAYDAIILRDLLTSLERKGESLTNPAKTDQFTQLGKQVSFDPTELISFNQLKDYVDSLVNYEKNATLYNQLESSQSAEAIAQLVLYLYGRELPAPFYQTSSYFRTALGPTKDNNLKIGLYRDLARQKLSALFNKFLLDAFNTKENLKPLFDLQDLLIGLSDPSVSKMDDNDLRGLLAKLQEVQKLANTETFKWIENKDFFPGEKYNDILTKIGSSELLGTAIANDLTNEANRQYQTFKETMTVFKTDLSGPFFRKISGQMVAQTAEKFDLLTTTLINFMSQRFMEFIKKYRELQPVPPQQIMVWDEVMLQNAASLIDDFRKYEAEDFTDAPLELQNVLRVTAQNALRKKLIHFVAKAQAFREAPTAARTAGLRDMLASQIQNLKLTTPLFSRILAVFEGVGFDESSNALKEALVEHSLSLLKTIERLVRDENLYEVRESNFRAWAGGKNLAYSVFGVSDAEGLIAYLAAQRERSVFYSKNMARPVIDFLNMSYFEKSPDTLPLIMRWDGLQLQIDQYEKKTPGNDITNLEEFITAQMNEITINDCEIINPVKGGSFFNTRLRKIQTLMKQKCESIAQKRFFMRYNKIAQFFNAQLAGRYPFKDGKASGGGSEASPRLIRTFYKVYERFTPYDLKRLENEAKDSVSKAEAYDFLKAMAGVKPLLVPDEGEEEGVTKDPPEFKIEFRSNREQEIGANQITQMSMKIGPQSINWRDPDKSGTFTPGVPIVVIFKWASNGQNVPKVDPSQPDLKVTGTEATFTYTGNWGVLKLLSNHAEGEPVGAGPTKVWRLKFVIPVTNVAQNQTTGSSSTTVFIDFELTEKGGGGTSQLASVTNKLPTSAKLLDENALALAEKDAAEEIKQAEKVEAEEAARNEL